MAPADRGRFPQRGAGGTFPLTLMTISEQS
jgi:hypothetical protein